MKGTHRKKRADRATVLFVHQSSDLYGSDRALLYLISQLDRTICEPVVLLPRDGPLLYELNKLGIEVHVLPLALLQRSSITIINLIKLVFQVFRSVSAIQSLFAQRSISIVHTNTIAVLSGAIWAKVRGIHHVWHVHEIVTHSRIIHWFVAIIIRLFSDVVVCNSSPTLDRLVDGHPKLRRKSVVIWNGIEAPRLSKKKGQQIRNKLGVGKGCLLIVLVGRINRWKGQHLFVEAAQILWNWGMRNIHFLIVGDPPLGQEFFKHNLIRQIQSIPVHQKISVWEFCKDIWSIWDACDVAVVPSTEPEPFGLVALEAMAVAKPIIAAAHGGIAEIVVDGQTGIHVAPCDPNALARAIRTLALSKQRRQQYGKAGYERFQRLFTLKDYARGFDAVYRSMLVKEGCTG